MQIDPRKLKQSLIDNSGETASRAQRVLRNPIRMLYPIFMRKFALEKPCSIDTFWGGRFDGVLPEAVSTMVWRNGYFDRDVSLTLVDLLKPGSTFVDIGAHFGFFSLLASHLVGPSGRVVSIEAMPSTFQQLKKNADKNGRGNISTVQNAAFNSECILEFTDFGLVASSLNSAFENRGASDLPTQATKVDVQARPADDILSELKISSVEVLKIDAESSEKFVLDGLSKTLRMHKPAVVMEVSDIAADGGSTSELVEKMKSLGYRPFKWSNIGTLDEFSVGQNTAYANLVFKPV